MLKKIFLLFSLLLSSASAWSADYSSLRFQFDDGSTIVVIGEISEGAFVAANSHEGMSAFQSIWQHVQLSGFEDIDIDLLEEDKSTAVEMDTTGDNSTAGFLARSESGEEFVWLDPKL